MAFYADEPAKTPPKTDRVYCSKCLYACGLSGRADYLCEYILFTGERRGCKAGRGCTKRKIARPQRPASFLYGKGEPLKCESR